MTTIQPTKRQRHGDWLPENEHALSHFRASLTAHAQARKHTTLSAPVRKLSDLIEETPLLHMHLTQAIHHAQMLEKTHPEIQLGYSSIAELMVLIDAVMTLSIPFSTSSLVGCPIQALFDWPMCMPEGFAFFQSAEVNVCIRAILNHWRTFLSGSESRTYLNDDSPSGWFSQDAKPYVDMSLFECDPSAPHYGFTSWNDFFTRRLKPDARPVAGEGDPSIVVSACEATPYHIQRHVKLKDTFWVKTQRYSLRDIFTANQLDLAERFVGGSVFQGFLSAYNYHRWHAPVDGTVVEAYPVSGTYYADVTSVHLNPDGPENSQGYITAVATRAVMVIDTGVEGLGLVACVFVGMCEISSCVMTVSIGDSVKKGDEIGYFQYGGSTHCVIFEPEVKLDFVPKPPFGAQTGIVDVNSHLATVAL